MSHKEGESAEDLIQETDTISQPIAKLLGYAYRRGLTPERIFYYAAYICLAVLFTTLYFKSLAPYRRATLYKLTTFSADTPFQYRILIPYVASIIWKHTHFYLHSIYSFITAASTFLLLLSFRKYLMLFISEKAASFGAVLIMYPIFWNYCSLPGYYLPSDIPAIAFFVFGLTLIYMERWELYFPLLILATFNRETSCFLICAYAVTMFGKQQRKVYWMHLACQAAIWISIKFWVDHLFITNGGQKLFENQIWNNIHFIQYIFAREPHALWRLYTFGFIWLLIPLYWKKQPQFFKRLLWVFVPFISGMSIVGRLQEVRIYSELIPLMVAPAAYGLYHLLGEKPVYSHPPVD